MKTSDERQIEAFLKEHHGFSECIIEELAMKDYGTTFEVVFNYIWSDKQDVRVNVDEPKEILLRFRMVQELRISNALNSSILRNPNSTNWGLNEVAFVEVVNDEDGSYLPKSLDVPFTHVVFLWEGDRRIDVVFSELEVRGLVLRAERTE